ncbi:hypothetical protein [Streptomyces sp. NPDC021020]|uniref:hypothetical protein n=1 Tax=Streptomyces sp. NPDC021020 TaxID=3365109 RepID=UPI00378CB8F4
MPSLRTALALTMTAAAAVLAPAAAATAATPAPAAAPDAGAELSALPTSAVTSALGPAVAPVRDLTLDPLSNTGVDPLDNGVGSQVADFQPVSTTALTDPVTHGGSLGTLPVTGEATGLLTG